MQKAALRLRATVLSTIFQSHFFLLGPAVALLQQRIGRKMVGRHGAAPCSAV